MSAAQRRWEAAQKAAVANFKPVTHTYTISKCPSCYGSLPQGNESAWAKGCKQCDLMNECGKATNQVYYASMSKKEFNESAQTMLSIMSKEYWLKTFGDDPRLTVEWKQV